MITISVIVIVIMIVVAINIISAAGRRQYARQIYTKLFKCWNVKINTSW